MAHLRRSLVLALACAYARVAAAETRSFDLDHLQLALTSGDFLAVEGAGPARRFAFRLGAAVRYLDRPLLADDAGATRALIASRALADVTASVALASRLTVAVDLPVLLAQSGQAAAGALPPAGATATSETVGAALGDLRLAGRLHGFDVAGLAGDLLVGVRFPTGSAERFLGEGWFVVEPRAALEWRGRLVRAGLNLGARLRESRQVGDLTVGNEATMAAAVGVRPLKFLDLFAELHADAPLASDVTWSRVPVEALGGGGVRFAGFEVRLAAGAGLVQGYGDPRFRLLAAIAWSPERAQEKVAAPPVPPRPAPRPSPPVVAAAPPPAPPPPAPVVDAPHVEVTPDFVNLSEPIFFDLNRAHIHARFHAELEELARVITTDATLGRVWIEGHADASGPVAWNHSLSTLRAERVAEFLVKLGVPAERLGTLAAGETKPWFSNTQADGRARNRRVVMFIERAAARAPSAPQAGTSGASAGGGAP